MTPEEKVNMLEEKLILERSEWNTKIKDLVPKIRHVDELASAQVDMLSNRHALVDKIIERKNLISKEKSKYWTKFKDLYRGYKTQYDLKLNNTEINDFIKNDQKYQLRIIELLETQIEYYRGVVDTLDKMGFAIKNKIMIEQSWG